MENLIFNEILCLTQEKKFFLSGTSPWRQFFQHYLDFSLCVQWCAPLCLMQPTQWRNVPLGGMHWGGLILLFHCMNIPLLGTHAQLLVVATASNSGRASVGGLVMVPASHPPSSQMYMQRCSIMWCDNMFEKCMVPTYLWTWMFLW